MHTFSRNIMNVNAFILSTDCNQINSFPFLRLRWWFFFYFIFVARCSHNGTEQPNKSANDFSLNFLFFCPSSIASTTWKIKKPLSLKCVFDFCIYKFTKSALLCYIFPLRFPFQTTFKSFVVFVVSACSGWLLIFKWFYVLKFLLVWLWLWINWRLVLQPFHEKKAKQK